MKRGKTNPKLHLNRSLQSSRPLLKKLLLTLPLLLQLSLVQAASEGRQCKPEPGDEHIEYGDLITCAIEDIGETDIFRFTGSADEQVLVQVARRTEDSGTPCVEIFRPDGTQLGARCGFFGARVDSRLDQSGTHTIRVAEQLNDKSLAYTLVLDRLATTSPAATSVSPGVIVADLIAPNSDIDLFFIQGQSGDTVSVQVTRLTEESGTPCVEFFRPDGTRLGSRCGFFGARIDVQLDQSGEHTILVSEQLNDRELNYDLEYQCIAGICPPVDRNRRYVGTTSLPDINSNTSGEVVALFQELNEPRSTNVGIKDGDDGADIKTIPVLEENFKPVGVTTIGDLNADTVPELAVLATKLDDNTVVVSIVDPISMDILSSLKIFDSEWMPIGLTMVHDLDDDATPEVGVLAVDRDNNTILRIQDPLSGDLIRDIRFEK